MKKYDLISKVTLGVLMLIGILAALIFFVGGNEAEGYEVAGDILAVPNYTNLFLFTNYLLFALVLCVTLYFVIKGFVETCKVDMKKAMSQLAVVVGIVLLFVVCWIIGSPEKLDIIGYDGEDNQGFWAQLSDMMIYVTYVLLAATVGTICWGAVYTRIKK